MTELINNLGYLFMLPIRARLSDNSFEAEGSEVSYIEA